MQDGQPNTNSDQNRSTRKTSLVVLFAFVAWSALGIGLANQVVLARPMLDGVEFPWSQALFESLFLTYFWGIVSFGVLGLVRRFPMNRQKFKYHAAIHIFAALTIPFFYTAACLLLPGVEDQFAAQPKTFTGRILAFGGFIYQVQVFFYLLILMGCHAIEFYRKLRDKEIVASRLQTELANANLKELKAQLNPHFLFNTLSAITTYIHEDPDLAEKMTVRLSQLLRLSLEASDKHLRPLADELNFLQKYVEIQTMRFGNRVQYLQDIQPSCEKVLVPTLLLQPLVENAFKHGVERSTDCCTVKVSVSQREGNLQVTVHDNGPGNKQIDTGGVGLQNTRSRLHHLFGKDSNFLIDQEKGFKVKLTFPARRESL